MIMKRIKIADWPHGIIWEDTEVQSILSVPGYIVYSLFESGSARILASDIRDKDVAEMIAEHYKKTLVMDKQKWITLADERYEIDVNSS